MKTLFFAVLLYSFTSFAETRLPWIDLETGGKYKLTQEIVLGASHFPSGLPLVVVEREALGIPVFFIRFEQTPCAQPESQNDMEIIIPIGNHESTAVGVQIAPGCQWEVYIENKDLYTESFFAGI